MAAELSLSQDNPISNPDSPEFRAACETLPLCALGILAWMHYAGTYFPNETVTMDVLDPYVEDAVRELLDGGFIYIDGVL